MQYSSAVLEAVITELTRLPGLGRKSAQRIAFHLLRSSEGDARKLAQAILDLKSRVEDCRVCGNVTETQPCAICADPRRDSSILCVVEQPMDVLALERTGEFNERQYRFLHLDHLRDVAAGGGEIGGVGRLHVVDGDVGRAAGSLPRLSVVRVEPARSRRKRLGRSARLLLPRIRV